MKNPNRGRVYRRCACRSADGRQLGARCPKLTNRKHGAWTYAVDLPTLDRKRRTRRRSGFATKADAQVALSKVLKYERTKASTLKPTTMANYHAYVHKDLIPHIGLIRLEDLSHQHVVLYVRNQLEAGRGHTTLRRCLATLSSALGDAVRHTACPTTRPDTSPSPDQRSTSRCAGHQPRQHYFSNTAPITTNR
ncbi:tyrosine-type recombinase/integrase [Lentzea atacamensis]|uniref:hypothetical protein n=1 Tax=Lentzea atacamensis TaxID=531938 RepID=UPI0014765BB5|nr:hypothetical protein [Lentzea atacamensis]